MEIITLVNILVEFGPWVATFAVLLGGLYWLAKNLHPKLEKIDEIGTNNKELKELIITTTTALGEVSRNSQGIAMALESLSASLNTQTELVKLILEDTRHSKQLDQQTIQLLELSYEEIRASKELLTRHDFQGQKIYDFVANQAAQEEEG